MCVTNFVILQVSGPQPWYVMLHNNVDFENKIACLKLLISRPVGNKSLTITDLFVIRLVQNIHSTFTAICDGK